MSSKFAQNKRPHINNTLCNTLCVENEESVILLRRKTNASKGRSSGHRIILLQDHHLISPISGFYINYRKVHLFNLFSPCFISFIFYHYGLLPATCLGKQAVNSELLDTKWITGSMVSDVSGVPVRLKKHSFSAVHLPRTAVRKCRIYEINTFL